MVHSVYLKYEKLVMCLLCLHLGLDLEIPRKRNWDKMGAVGNILCRFYFLFLRQTSQVNDSRILQFVWVYLNLLHRPLLRFHHGFAKKLSIWATYCLEKNRGSIREFSSLINIFVKLPTVSRNTIRKMTKGLIIAKIQCQIVTLSLSSSSDVSQKAL